MSRLKQVCMTMAALTAAQPFGAPMAQAQADSVATLEEIIVTSRRREEKLQDVPVAVTALSEQTIRALDLTDTTKVANFSPSLQFVDWAPGNIRADRGQLRPLVFRGLYLPNTGTTSVVSAAALTFLDGAPIIGNEIPPGVDIARVEVLRGPQSVYFGRSTMTGAVSYITKDVGDAWGFEFEGKAATYDTQSLQFSAAGPVIADGKLGVRLTGSTASNDGYDRNAFNTSEVLGDRSSESLSITLDSTPFEALKLKGFVSTVTYDDGPAATGKISPAYNNCVVGTRSSFCGSLPSFQPSFFWNDTETSAAEREFLFNVPVLGDDQFDPQLGMQRELFLSHLVANLEIANAATLQSITAYHTDNWMTVSDYVFDPFGPATATGNSTVAAKTRDWSQELRVSSVGDQRLRWTLGASYTFAQTIGQALTWQQSRAQVNAGIPAAGIPQAIGVSRAKASGVFGGVYFDVFEPLTLSIEGRYQEDERMDSAGGVSFEDTFENFSPRISVDYRLNPDVMLYASYAEGNRPGGFNRSLLPFINNPAVMQSVLEQSGTNQVSFEEEILDTYEIGVKSELFGGRARANFDVYYGTLKDQQLSNGANVAAIGATVTVTANQGSVRIYGAEFDGAWQISNQLSASATFAWNETDRLKFQCNSCIAWFGTNDLSGTELPFAPEYSGSLALDYRDSVGASDWDWFAHTDYVYRGEYWLEAVNLVESDAQNLVNLRAGVDNGSVMIEGFVTNVTDDRYMVGNTGSDFSGRGFTAYNFGLTLPRIYGMRLRYKF